ncbi:hypothetical protein CKAH01_07830 [Colletotrichum kahawae]|uniref:Uncharacterized protein n=1 Tax=Colletotrichum kahawae TaxID=34407 RepID=A0AAD9Y4X5_COLKA|nr:hypothetical protein CKAH01_07830 [Colletotrichum kahawae]
MRLPSFRTAEGKAVPYKTRLSITKQTREHAHTHHDNISHPPSSMQRNHGASLPIRRSLPSAQMTPQRGTTAGALPPVVDVVDLTLEFRRQVCPLWNCTCSLFASSSSALRSFDLPNPTRQPSAAPPSAAAASEIPKENTTWTASVYNGWLAKFREVVAVCGADLVPSMNRFAHGCNPLLWPWGKLSRHSSEKEETQGSQHQRRDKKKKKEKKRAKPNCNPARACRQFPNSHAAERDLVRV